MSKKTVKLIINNNHDYIICLKRNQKILYNIFALQRQNSQPIDVDINSEVSRDRDIKRTIEVFNDVSDIDRSTWLGIKSFICVTREGKRGDKDYFQRVYYISSLEISAAEFGQRIRDLSLIHI